MGKSKIGLIIGLIGGILLIAGSFLPWGVIAALGKTEKFLGIKGAGIFTLALGILGIVFLAIRKKLTIILGLLSGMGAVTILILQANMFLGTAETAPPRVKKLIEAGLAEMHLGIGIYLSIAGGALLIIGGIMRLIGTKTSRKAEV